MDPKEGESADDKFRNLSEILIRVCKHPNTTKDIILDFDKALRQQNPKYKHELSTVLTQALNSRRA